MAGGQDKGFRLLPHRGGGPPQRERPSAPPPPPGDHLARYLDAYTAGQLSRAYMRAVVGELVVIARGQIVPDGAR
jgi:hypothetical protein